MGKHSSGKVSDSDKAGKHRRTVPYSFVVEGVTLYHPNGPDGRVLLKSERKPINQALTRCGLETMGKNPTVEMAQRAYVALYNRVRLGRAQGVIVEPATESKPKVKVSTYIPVEKPLAWKGQPVSQKQYNHYLRMSAQAKERNAQRAAERSQREFEEQVAEVTQAVLAILS